MLYLSQEELHEFAEWTKNEVSANIYQDVIVRWMDSIYEPSYSNPGPSISEMRVICKLHRKYTNGNDAVWITLSHDHLNNHLVANKRNVARLKEFCDKWFDKKRYSYYSWIIESGENAEDPHIHVHALVQFKHKSLAKNHARDLKKYYKKKVFHELKGKDYYSQNVNGMYKKDKLEYMNNASKGSHENYSVDVLEDFGVEGEASRQFGELL